MTQTAEDTVFLRRALEATIRIGLVFLLASWCIDIILPFLTPFIWGAIISVAIYPLHSKLAGLFGGRQILSSVLITLIGLAILITPTVMLSTSTVESAQDISERLENDTLTVPPPPATVREWPLVGERLHDFWRLASTNLEAAIKSIAPHLKQISAWTLKKIAGAGFGILEFIVAICIAGVLLVNAQGARRTVDAFAIRVAGERGGQMADLASATVRSVAQGVLGVALIQALLAGAGFLVVGVPAAGVWTLLVLLLAVVQLPTLLILAPIAVWVFSVESGPVATGFLIWALLVGASDNVLKPLLLGRGLDIPMLVILIGAIGGMIASGIIGLFVGSVVLALGYKLFMAWLYDDTSGAAGTPASPT